MLLFMLIISFIQMCFLPGCLFVKCASKKIKIDNVNMIDGIVFSFASSLLFNYLLCIILFSLGIFRQPVMIAVVIGEFIFAGYLFYYDKRKCVTKLNSIQVTLGGRTDNNFYVYRCVVAIAVSISLAWVLMLSVNNIGTIFMDNDAVGAYNKWAEMLVDGEIPYTAYYPMLIVTNWALGYVLTGTTLQFSAKAMMPLFLMLILLMLFNLYLTEKKRAYLLAIPCVCVIVHRMSYFYICEGSMDYAISFFAVGGSYCLIRAKRESDNVKVASWYLLMAAIMSICIGVTKQAGLLIGPLLVLLMVCYGLRSLISRKQLMVFGIAFSIIVLSFYLWSFIGVQIGTNASYVDWLVGGIHGGRTLFQRIYFAAVSVYGYWLICFPVMIILALISLLDKTWRWVNICIFFPYTIVWVLGFSYDTRNWTVGTILWAIGIAVGIDYIMECLHKKWHGIMIVDGIIAVTVSLGCFWALSCVSEEDINSLHIEQEKTLVDAELNEVLYEYFEDKQIEGKILSYMSHIGQLPELGEYYVGAGLNYASDNEYDTYINNISNEDVAYIVFPDIESGYKNCPKIKEDIEQRIENKEMTIVWQNGVRMFAVLN